MPVHPNLVPSMQYGMQTPWESRRAVPAPCSRASPSHDKRFLSQNRQAGENKSRKDVKGGEDA